MQNLDSQQKATNEYFELDSFYKNGSHGFYSLWGNNNTIESSTILQYGWGYNPNRDNSNHGYHVSIWDPQEESKEKFLEDWAWEKENAD